MPPAKKRASSAATDERVTPAVPAGDEIAREIAGHSYEQARDELVDVVRRLESGAETLEESLTLWQRGEALARHCERWLAGARERIETAQREAAQRSERPDLADDAS